MADVYRFKKNAFDGTESYRIYTSSGVQTGDMMQWDAVARYATTMTTTSGAIFLGVSQDSNPAVGLGTPTRPLTNNECRIMSQGVHVFKTTSGDTYAHRDAVFMGADAQTVTKTSAGSRIGRVHLPDGTTVVGGTTTQVPVLVAGAMTTDQ